MQKKKERSSVSVVIPTYLGKDLLKKNLPSVLTSLRNGDEVIIIDDGGFASTLEWLKKKFKLGRGKKQADFTLYTGSYRRGRKQVVLRYVLNHTNLRFAANSNRGVALAQHRLIFLLNDDVSTYPETVGKLVSYFEDKKVFAVACLEFEHHDGDLKSGKNKLWFERGMFIHSRGDDLTTGPTAWASGGSAMFDRDKWLQLGGFDPVYYPAYWEDIDLSARARERGWQVLFSAEAKVDHNHETTNSHVFGQKKIKKMSWQHARIFTLRHADVWQKIAYYLWQPYWWWKMR